jgi:hypothetical protein
MDKAGYEALRNVETEALKSIEGERQRLAVEHRIEHLPPLDHVLRLAQDWAHHRRRGGGASTGDPRSTRAAGRDPARRLAAI